jgi:DNA-binding CsgD family transcriptional regulator/tetratricopeptide (TPR) repeat protein
MAALSDGLERAASGEPAAFAIGGEAGVGKSRVLDHVREQAQERGARVLAGDCMSLTEAGAPLMPVVEALRTLPNGHGEDGDAAPALAPEWSGTVRRYELMVRRLERHARRRPLLLALEDLHWADRSTLDFLRFLLRSLRTRPASLMVVVTHRSDEVQRRPDLRAWLAEAGRVAFAERLSLRPFTRAEVAEQIEAIAGEAPPAELVQRIFTRSEGNAFIAEELLAAARDGEEEGLPDTLHDVLLSRLTVLQGDARAVVRAAATAGPRVEHGLLAAVAGLDEPALSDALREAMLHGVLVLDERGTSYRFRHGLLQEVAYLELLPGERERLHEAIASALEADPHLVGGDAPSVAAQVSEHWLHGHDPTRALPAAVRAGLEAERVNATSEAQLQFERALALWERVPRPEELAGRDRADLVMRAAHAAAARGQHERALGLVGEAQAALGEDADPARASALLERRASFLRAAGRRDEALEALHEAIALVPPDAGSEVAVRLQATVGRTLTLAARHSEACSVCAGAVELARAAGATGEEALALACWGSSLISLGETERGLACLREAREVVRREGGGEHAVVVLIYHADALDRCGRFEEAAETGSAALRECRRLGFEWTYGVLAAHNTAAPLFRLGRWEEADRLLAAVITPSAAKTMSAFCSILRARIAVARGDFAAAREHLRDVAATGAAAGAPEAACSLAACSAELHLWEGRLDDARATLLAGLEALRAADDPLLTLQLVALLVRVEADAAEQARALRRPGEAQGALARADAHPPPSGGDPGSQRAALAAAVAAERARLLGDDDPSPWAAAVEAGERWGEIHPVAYARFRLAECLLARPGPRGDAAQQLRRAHRAAGDLGARPLAGLVEALARRARIDLAEPEAVAPPPVATERFGLTAREIEVLEHVSTGATNRQIAEALYISSKTAGVHVSNILRKLSVSTRGEAAAVAHRAGLVD